MTRLDDDEVLAKRALADLQAHDGKTSGLSNWVPGLSQAGLDMAKIVESADEATTIDDLRVDALRSALADYEAGGKW